MRIAYVAVLLAELTVLAHGHISMTSPCPRYSKYGHFCPALPKGQKVDTDLPPIGTAGKDDSLPLCHHTVPWTTSAAQWTAGQSITVTFRPNEKVYGGGHCQFSISYDDGKNFVVIYEKLKYCFLNGHSDSDTPEVTSYKFNLPEELPSSDHAIFAWSWVSAGGQRSFYMNCADVSISGKSDSYRGKNITLVNYPDYPTLENFEENYDLGIEFYTENKNFITVTADKSSKNSLNVRAEEEPFGGDETKCEDEDNIDEPVETPDDPVETPDDPVETPDDADETPDDAAEAPDDPVETPDDPVETPDDADETPDDAAGAPNDPDEAPDDAAEASDDPEEAPDDPVETPDDAAETPDDADKTPDDAAEAPDDAEEAPDDPVETPDDPAETPDDPAETPDDAAETPDDADETPDDAAEAPNDPDEAPDDPAEAPDDPVETPDDPTTTPSETEAIEGKPIKGIENTNDTEEGEFTSDREEDMADDPVVEDPSNLDMTTDDNIDTTLGGEGADGNETGESDTGDDNNKCDEEISNFFNSSTSDGDTEPTDGGANNDPSNGVTEEPADEQTEEQTEEPDEEQAGEPADKPTEKPTNEPSENDTTETTDETTETEGEEPSSYAGPVLPTDEPEPVCKAPSTKVAAKKYFENAYASYGELTSIGESTTNHNTPSNGSETNDTDDLTEETDTNQNENQPTTTDSSSEEETSTDNDGNNEADDDNAPADKPKHAVFLNSSAAPDAAITNAIAI